LRETHVRGECRSVKLKSLTDVAGDFEIPNLGKLFRAQIEEDWGTEITGLVLGYNLKTLMDEVRIKLHNGLSYYRQPFHAPATVERIGLDCKVEYTNANKGMMPRTHTVWVQHAESEHNHLDNNFQGRVPSFPILYFTWTPPNKILQFREHLPDGKILPTFSKRCKKRREWILRPRPQAYAVVIPTKFQDRRGWADKVDGFIRVVKLTHKMHIVPVGAIVGPAHLVREDEEVLGSNRGDDTSIWLLNNKVDLDTNWTVY
jgi:hypothetical protein